MTDIITTAPITIRRPNFQSLALPKLGIGAAIAGISTAIMQAVDLAYVAPYRANRQSPPAAIDTGLEGRDPNW